MQLKATNTNKRSFAALMPSPSMMPLYYPSHGTLQRPTAWVHDPDSIFSKLLKTYADDTLILLANSVVE